MSLAIEVVGWISAVVILVSYLLVSAGRLSGQSAVFQWMNVVGAGGFIVNTAAHGAWPSAALNTAWLLIGVVTLTRIAIGRAARD